MVAPFYIPTINTQGFQFLHKLANTYFSLLGNSHPNGFLVVSHCGFDLICISLMIVMLTIFYCAHCPSLHAFQLDLLKFIGENFLNSTY